MICLTDPPQFQYQKENRLAANQSTGFTGTAAVIGWFAVFFLVLKLGGASSINHLVCVNYFDFASHHLMYCRQGQNRFWQLVVSIEQQPAPQNWDKVYFWTRNCILDFSQSIQCFPGDNKLHCVLSLQSGQEANFDKHPENKQAAAALSRCKVCSCRQTKPPASAPRTGRIFEDSISSLVLTRQDQQPENPEIGNKISNLNLVPGNPALSYF